MYALLAFVAVLVVIVAIGVAINRLRGGRAHYLDAWTPAAGERTLWEDREADFHVVPRLGQARRMSFARMRRTHAVLTDVRIIVATRALLSRRYMITHMIHLAGRDDGPPELAMLSGGLYSTGYIVLSARPAPMTLEDGGARDVPADRPGADREQREHRALPPLQRRRGEPPRRRRRVVQPGAGAA